MREAEGQKAQFSEENGYTGWGRSHSSSSKMKKGEIEAKKRSKEKGRGQSHLKRWAYATQHGEEGDVRGEIQITRPIEPSGGD